MSLSFYYPDKEYVEELQKTEIEKRGFTHVPNMKYDESKKPKFVCGIVLEIGDISYCVPVTSYTKKQKDNILIEVKEDRERPIKGSLRFNYMFPVPKEYLNKINFEEEETAWYRKLLKEEYTFCKINEMKIRSKAKQTYKKVIHKYSENIVKNSCDFKLLEEVYRKRTFSISKSECLKPKNMIKEVLERHNKENVERKNKDQEI